MNKQRHRLVFNARRGQIMAVAESASCVGGAAKTSSVGLALLLMLVFSASTPAQIITDPNAPSNQRPTVHSAPNGVPLVNIQTPTPAGVSRNAYQQFDVQSNGAILNNSRTQVQTQLGGWVQGNPWLATGSARIIVNEVNSSHPSLLRGHVEVAGERAQVIIANPSGIQVQGGGFINASRATLTTGKPVWSHGDLEGFRVQGGTIRIDGAGLDASSTDYTAILARAVEINAGIWAKELTVVTGANEIGASRVEPIPSQATGAVPTYALDVAELGGMYAGKIHLIGTEVGVGVNLRGVVGATSGDVVVDASGKLYQRGTLQASGSVRVQTSEAIHNSGDLYSGADLSMSTTQALTNSGRIDAAGHLQLQAAGVDNQAGARIAATADVDVRVEGPMRNQGEMVSAGQLLVRADTLDNANGQLQGRRLDIDVRTLNNQQGSLWQTGTQALHLTLGELDNAQGRIGSSQPLDGGTPTGGGSGSGGGTGAPAGGGASGGGSAAPGGSTGSGSAVPQLAPGLVQVSGQTLNQDGVIAAEGLIGASVQGLQNNNGSLYVDRIDIRGAAVDNTGGYIGARQAELNVDALSNTDGAIEAQELQLNTTRLDNTRGLLSASQAFQIIATERLNNVLGDIQSLQGDVRIEAGQLLNAGRVRSAADLTLLVGGELVNTGVVAAEGDATISAGSLASSGALAAGLHADGQLASEGDLKITTTQTLQANGLNLAAGTLSLTGSALNLANSRTGARSQHLQATAGDVDTRGATVVAADLLSVDANSAPTQTLNNAGGSLSASQVRLQVANLDNTQGQISHTGTGELLITTPGRLENASGTITAVGTMTLLAQDLGNARGRVVGGTDVTVRSATLDNTASGTVHAYGDLLLRTGQLDNTGGTLQAVGHLTALGEGSSTTLINREGLIRAGGTTDLSAQYIDNSQTRGDQQGIEGLNVSLSAATVANQSGSVVASQDLAVTSTGHINNAQGQLSAGRTLSLLDAAASTGGTASLNITNTAGTLLADELVRVRAASIGLDGQILSRQDIDLQVVGNHTVAEGASVVANRHLTFKVDSGDLTNNGNLQAGKRLEVDSRYITNNATGTISAETVRLRALEDLVNRGLIDGVDTEVRARNLTNTATGRIYGEGVRVQSTNNLTNEGNAVIAAHDTLQLGVGGTLTNQDGATLLSLGELAVGGALDADGEATGAAQAIHNRSALIEGTGDMRLSAGQLNNLNDQLTHQLVPGEGTSRTEYYTSIGYVGSEDVAWTAPMVLYAFPDRVLYWPNRVSLILKSSPYASQVFRSYFLGPDAFVPEHDKLVNPVNDHYVRVPDTFSYGRTSPIWQDLGLTAPDWEAPGPRPQPKEGINNTTPPDPQVVAAWEAKVAPWQVLNQKIAAFKTAINAHFLDYELYRSYTETTQTAQVTASRPAEILSGGDLALHVAGTTLNQDSSIMAGGRIDLQGGSVVNRSTEVSAPTQRTGTMNNWAVIGQDCDFGFGCDPVYGWASAPYAETINRNVALGAVRYEQGVHPQAPSAQPGTFTPGNTQAQAHAAGAVPQAPGGAPNGGPGTQLPGMASPPPLHDGVPDAVRIGAPNLTLPSSALFQLHPGSTSGYLVETDPRFADRRQWLSSDYMLAALAVDPTTAQKRLGDGYYEQRLVREQVASLTGQRYLGDYTSDEQQYRALMNAGATFAQAHQLRPGIALSAAQVAALTSDIVWLVERSITLPDGTTTLALVPQLYVRPQAGDLQPSGALLAGKSVNLQLSSDLINASGTIAGRQVTQINATNVHNLGGLITSGQVTAVTAAQDIRNIGGAIGAQDALVLDAGRDLLVQTTTAQGQGQAGAGTYSSQGIDRVAALYVSNPNGLLLAGAGRDVNLTAALVQSEGSVQLQAGRDITLDTVQIRTDIAVQRDDRNYAGVRQSEEIGTHISSGGGTRLIAGQDIQARAAQVQAQGQLALQAGRDVNIEAGQQGLATDNASFAQGKGFLSSGSTEVREHRSETHAVASNLGGDQVAIRSGQDTTVQGTRVVGEQSVVVVAGHNINVTAGSASSASMSASHASKSGVLSGKSDATQTSATTEMTVGSSIEGRSVEMTAGQDITIKGSSVNAQELLLLDAGRDVSITSGQNSASGSQFSETRRSGFTVSKEGLGYGKSAQDSSGNFATTTQAGSSVSGGDVIIASGRDTRIEASTVVADDLLGIDAGRDVLIVSGVDTRTSAQASNDKSKGINLVASGLTQSVTILHDTRSQGDGTDTSATAAASTVGSLGGDVIITAAQKYQQTGSDVLALEGDIDIQARQVEIAEAREARSATSQQSSKSTVLGATPRNALVDAIQGVKTTAETAMATAQTGNSRAQALGAAATALNAYNTAKQVAELVANPEKIASVTIDFSLSSNKSQSDSTETADVGRASTVAAAGDVRITAKGAGAESDLLIRGSEVSAGNNATLKAEGDVLLESSQDVSTLHSTNTSSGASVGVGLSLGATTGITFNASANKGKGNADGQDVVQRNTHIVAGNTARIESGADTTLAGATVSAHSVQAEVGGNLNIESRQDTGQFKSDQNSSGFGVSLCIPPFCYGTSSVSVSGGEQNIESEFASVAEQSAIRAGDGGFQVNVQGDTTLTGGAITSTDKAVQDHKNRFATGGDLTLSDVENHARYEADGYSLNVAVAVAGAEPTTAAQQKLAPATPAKTDGSAGIGEDGGTASSTTQAAISGIAGNTEARTGDAEAGIAPIFDRDRVQKEIDAQVRITATFGQQAAKAVGSYAADQLLEAEKQQVQGQVSELQASKARAEGRDQDALALQTQADEAFAKAADLRGQWGEQGSSRVALHTLAGALAGGVAGAAGAASSTLIAPQVSQLAEQLGLPEPLKQVLVLGATGAAGAIAGGGTGAAAAINETTNNYLTSAQQTARDKEIAACKSLSCTVSVKMKYGGVDALQDAGLLIGIGGGIGYQTVEQASAIVEMVKNLPETLQALGALVNDPEFRAKVGEQVTNDYMARVEMQTRAYNDGGWDGSITAGVEAGRLAVDIVGTATAVMGAGKVVATTAKAGSQVIASAVARTSTSTAQLVDEYRVLNNIYRDGASPELARQMFDSAAKTSTRNPDSSEVILGKYVHNSPTSYEQVAQARGATYFEVPDWVQVQAQLGESQMWNLNKAFLEQQIATGKKFIFTSDPTTFDLKSYGFQEYKFLTDNGYRIQKMDGLYHAIKH